MIVGGIPNQIIRKLLSEMIRIFLFWILTYEESDDIAMKLTMSVIFALDILLIGCGKTIFYGGEV